MIYNYIMKLAFVDGFHLAIVYFADLNIYSNPELQQNWEIKTKLGKQ